jgi:hypothetical protein
MAPSSGIPRQLANHDGYGRALRTGRFTPNVGDRKSPGTKIVDEHVLRRQNLQIAFGEIVEDINQLKTFLPRLTGSDEEIANLHAMFRSSRRMQRFAVAVSIVSLLTAVYIGMGKPGWPTIAALSLIVVARLAS